MTIRRSINIEQARDDYEAFREAVEAAPEGTFDEAKSIRGMIDAMFDTMFNEARDRDIAVDNCDGSMEIEIVIFDMIRDNNPSAAEAAIGLGRTLLDYPETRERVLAGLERDRDFLREMRQRPNDFVPGVDDRYDREMPV